MLNCGAIFLLALFLSLPVLGVECLVRVSDLAPQQSREAFVRGFKKEGLVNSLPELSFAQRKFLTDRFPPERVTEIVRELAKMEVLRDMSIPDGLRGNATTVVITIRDKSGRVITQNAKGDPRTDDGKRNIRENVKIALDRYLSERLDEYGVR